MVNDRKTNPIWIPILITGLLIIVAILYPRKGRRTPQLAMTTIRPTPCRTPCEVGNSTRSALTQEILKTHPILTSISSSPCEVPCWEGITPGVTSTEEAKAILKNNSQILPGSLDCHGNSDLGGCTWWLKENKGWLQPEVIWKNGNVISINLGFDNSYSKICNVFDKYGLPEKVRIIGGGVPEHQYWIVNMYYPSKGVDFGARTEEGSYDITEQTEIGAITYYATTTLENWITLDKRGDLSLINHAMGDMRPWKGFGDLSKLYPEDTSTWP